MITIATVPLAKTFFIVIRLGVVFLFSPIEAFRLLPIHGRLLLVFALSLLIANYLPSISIDPSNHSELVIKGCFEACNGLILSLMVYLTFAIFQIAGQLIDTQMGLNAVAILNPIEHTYDPLSARLLMMLAVLFFFALNGHHQLLQALLFSFKLITPGQFILFDGFKPIVQQTAFMFSFGLMLSAPIIASLLMIDISSAILTRNMPQISSYFLTLPIKILLGLAMFGFLLDHINPMMEKAFQRCFHTFMEMMA